MSYQPKPTGEWTAESLWQLMGQAAIDNRLLVKAADAHNAALAAAIEFYVSERAQALAVTAGALQQLAAERESFWRDRDKWNELHHKLREQLHAERENAEKAAARAESAQIALSAAIEKAHGDGYEECRALWKKEAAAHQPLVTLLEDLKRLEPKFAIFIDQSLANVKDGK